MAPIREPEVNPKIFDNFFGRIAMKNDPFLEAHPVGVMASLMGFASAVIDAGPRIVTREGSMPLSYWPILCGVTGGYKGRATHAALLVMEAALEGFQDSFVQEGFDSGLGVISYMAKRVNKDTGRPYPLVVIEEEMSKVIPLTRRDTRLNQALTKLFDGKSLTYATGKEELEVKRPHFAWIGHVQPRIFHQTRGSAASATGVWNRFMVLWVEKSKTLPMFQDVEGYDLAVEESAEELRRALSYARLCKGVRVPPHVAEVFEKHHRIKVEALKNQGEDIAEYAERVMAYFLRVSALYAIFDGRTTISERDMDSALALIEYSVDSLRFILSNSAKFSGRTTLAQSIFRFVTAHGPCTYTYMTTRVGRGNSKQAYLTALLELQDDVILYMLPKQKGKPGPSKAWYVATPDQLPEDAIPLKIDQIDPEENDQADASRHPNFVVQEDTEWTAERVDTEEEGNEPESEPEPLKALTPPRTPRPASEPPKRPRRVTRDHANPAAGKVTPPRRASSPTRATRARPKDSGTSWW